MLNPYCVSITGADDAVAHSDLVAISKRFPFVEWAVLYFPEKEGKARNPTALWRGQLAEARQAHGIKTALHLCGTDVFAQLLDGTESAAFRNELLHYDRVQVNINARGGRFNDEDVWQVYRRLSDLGAKLILQRHAGTEAVVDAYLRTHLAARRPGHLTVLYDTSRGRGVLPESWPAPLRFNGALVESGYAGGLSPANIERACTDIMAIIAAEPGFSPRFWLDMETGVRTDDQFDLAKTVRVLECVAGLRRDTADTPILAARAKSASLAQPA